MASLSIPMGSVLIVEDPIMDITRFSQRSATNQFKVIAKWTDSLRKMDTVKNTSSNSRALDSLCIATKHCLICEMTATICRVTQSEIKDVARFYTNAIGNCLYGLLSKINHGFPTNIAMSTRICDDDTSTERAVVFATKDLHSAEELQFDYFGILGEHKCRTHGDRASKFNIDVLAAPPLHNASFRALIDVLAGEFAKEGGGVAADVLEEVIESGLFTKLYGNGYSSSLLWLIDGEDEGRFAASLNRMIGDGVCREMYSIDAWYDYCRSSLGKAALRGFMGNQYNKVVAELLLAEECQ